MDNVTHLSRQHYTNLLEALDGLRAVGYIRDFNLGVDGITCSQSGTSLSTEEFYIDQVYRFDDFSSTDDSSILYAISSSQVGKGTLVSAYGMYADDMYLPMLTRLRQHAQPGNR